MSSSLVQVAGVVLSGFGTLSALTGAKKDEEAQKKAEKAREKQANLEAARQRRSVAREAQRNRASILASGTNKGAQQSSGVIGGIQQQTQDAAVNTRDINSSQELGGQVFAANRASAGARSQMAFGQGMQSLGGSLIENSSTISKLGTYYGG
jgi:hypothetical protein